MDDTKELAYWALRALAHTMAKEVLERRTMRPAAVLGALTDGFDSALKEYHDAEEKAEAGH